MSSGKLLQLKSPAASIFIADPAIADIQTPAPDKIFIYGKKPGRTTFFALRPDGTQSDSINISVMYNIGDLNRFLKAQAGDLQVEIVETPQGIILGGVVPTAGAAERVKALTSHLAGEGNTVISNLRVAGSTQVSIHVRIAEISKSVIKNLGVNWGATASSGVFTFGLASGNNSLLTSAVSSVVQNVAGGGTIPAKRGNITALVDALASQGLVSILAEPTLTAASGEKASFLAGGEFPVPITQSVSNNISVDYRQYGVSLNFTPIVLSDRLISLNVKPEVSDLSTAGAVTLNNFQIPALTTRRAETTVQLGSGESLVIAGLIQNRFNTEIDKIPGAGDIPVLGPLFSSTQFQKNESELIIIVTPYLVRPVASPDTFKVPTDNAAPTSDVERILEGRLGQGTGDGPRPVKLRGDPGFIYK
jgi:pilus assembly protein CpaC